MSPFPSRPKEQYSLSSMAVALFTIIVVLYYDIFEFLTVSDQISKHEEAVLCYINVSKISAFIC